MTQSQPPESETAVKERIYRQAAARAEAAVYSMNNSYLTNVQKAYVEGIYQFPIGVFSYSLLTMLAFGKQGNYLEAFLVAAFVSSCFAITIWVEASISFAKLGFLFSGTFARLVALGFAGLMWYQSNWVGTGIAIADAFGVLSFIAPSMWIYSYLGRGMHPKYRIAKKLFGTKFPFEEALSA